MPETLPRGTITLSFHQSITPACGGCHREGCLSHTCAPGRSGSGFLRLTRPPLLSILVFVFPSQLGSVPSQRTRASGCPGTIRGKGTPGPSPLSARLGGPLMYARSRLDPSPGRSPCSRVGVEPAEARVTRGTLIRFWDAVSEPRRGVDLPGWFLSWALPAFTILLKVKTIYRSSVNLCPLPTLFHSLTVSVTYWVTVKTGQRLYCPDDISAFHYQFYLGGRKKTETKKRKRQY